MTKFPRKIKYDTIKALLARTGNQCAFTNCHHPIFNDDNLLIAQLCHIEAVSPDGPRYNPLTTTEKVNSYENLIFLCYRHHKETDDKKYDIEQLRKIKNDHEQKFKESNFQIDDKAIKDVLEEINSYWTLINNVNRNEHSAEELKIEIDTKADEIKIIEDIRELTTNLELILGILSKGREEEHFDIICMGIPNTINRINTLFEQLEIKILELKLVTDPSNEFLEGELERLRINFERTAKSAGLFE